MMLQTCSHFIGQLFSVIYFIVIEFINLDYGGIDTKIESVSFVLLEKKVR